jgi:hypothetical protein
MQGFVPERSFAKERRVIGMRIDSVASIPCRCFAARPTSATGRSRIPSRIPAGSATCWSWRRRVSQPRRHSRQPHLMAKEIMPRLKQYKQPEAAQIAAA